MRPDGIIVMPPSFDQHFGLLQCREDLRVQDFVPELPELKLSLYPFSQGDPGSI